MSTLARSCLRMLLVYAALGTAIGVAVYHRFPQLAPAIWAGVIAGFFAWLTFAYLWAIPTHLRDWWRMRSGAPPRDGKRVAVIGTIHAAHSSLHAPFSKTSCVAYQYKVVSFKGQNPNTDFEGFAMTPSYVRTENGQVKILAYPELDVPEEPVRGPESKENAREFIDSTSFMAVRKEGLKAMTAELKQLLADDDGSMRYDHRMDPVAESLDHCRLTERVIRAGDTVCILGRYSEEKRAIVPDSGAVVHAATIRTGTPGSFRRGMLRKAIGSAFGVVVCAGLVTAAALIFLVNVPMDASEQMNPQRRFLWEEVKLERWLDKHVRTPLVQAGTLTAPGMRLRDDLCDHCAVGRFEANDRVIELRHASAWENESMRVVHLAAAAGETDGVTITFDRAARRWTIGLTMNGTTFTVPDAWTLPSDVQDSYGSGDHIHGRVTVLGPGDSVRVRAAFKSPIEQRPTPPSPT
jgi:hypothetical protein